MIEIMTVDHLDVFALRTYLNSLKQRGFTIVSVVPIKGELYAIIESPAPVTPKPGTSQVEPPPTERKVAQIIEVTADKTKNSGSPMWRCLCSDNTRVNIFQHQNPAIDNFEMFKSSGYGSILEAMPVGTTLRFTLQPIQVDLRKDMKWWEIVGVVPCPTEIPEPDPVIPENPPF